MSKNWYPTIDYDSCAECGACVEKCSHGVYDESKSPHPVVINPDNCIEGCTGCGSLCPADAIEYFGSDSDIQSAGCGCCCSGDDCASEPDSNSDCDCSGGCCD